MLSRTRRRRIQRNLEHLTALVEIDRAINFSFELHLSLTTLLTHVIVQLGVDAADVLLFDPASRTLEYVAGRGFHTNAIEHARQPWARVMPGGPRRNAASCISPI